MSDNNIDAFPLFEIALVLVRLSHVAGVVINVDYGVM